MPRATGASEAKAAMKSGISDSVLMAVATLLALGVGELVVRLVIPQVGRGARPDPTLGWSSLDFQHFDPESGAPGARRILFLGDSFLAGGGVVSGDERFPVVLGEALGEEWRTQIFATGGWGTDQELLAFLQKGRTWKPELVVVCFCATNDLSNNVSNSRGFGTTKPYFVADDSLRLELFDPFGAPADLPLAAFEPSRRPRSHLLDLFRAKLRLGRFLRSPPGDAPRYDDRFAAVDERYLRFARYQEPEASKLEKLAEVEQLKPRLSWSPQEGINHVSAFIGENHEENSYLWRLMEAILSRLDAETRSAGAELVVCVLPVPFKAQDARFVTGSEFEFRFATPAGEFTFRAAEPRDRLSEICSRRGIEFFDPTEDFLARVAAEDLLVDTWPDPTDIHFSGVGHRILAEQFLHYLESRASRR